MNCLVSRPTGGAEGVPTDANSARKGIKLVDWKRTPTFETSFFPPSLLLFSIYYFFWWDSSRRKSSQFHSLTSGEKGEPEFHILFFFVVYIIIGRKEAHENHPNKLLRFHRYSFLSSWVVTQKKNDNQFPTAEK